MDKDQFKKAHKFLEIIQEVSLMSHHNKEMKQHVLAELKEFLLDLIEKL